MWGLNRGSLLFGSNYVHVQETPITLRGARRGIGGHVGPAPQTVRLLIDEAAMSPGRQRPGSTHSHTFRSLLQSYLLSVAHAHPFR